MSKDQLRKATGAIAEQQEGGREARSPLEFQTIHEYCNHVIEHNIMLPSLALANGNRVANAAKCVAAANAPLEPIPSYDEYKSKFNDFCVESLGSVPSDVLNDIRSEGLYYKDPKMGKIKKLARVSNRMDSHHHASEHAPTVAATEKAVTEGNLPQKGKNWKETLEARLLRKLRELELLSMEKQVRKRRRGSGDDDHKSDGQCEASCHAS
ncbi:MAG: hypothetical protein Q9201_005604 [Fulgogasparrea decipioides]